MNTHELPMILFTVMAQLSVGTFIVLGVMDLVLSRNQDKQAVQRITQPVLYAIGPTLVLGLLISMLHMNDVLHVFNVFRNFGSSWLTREIVFGIGFAAVGFLFAFLEWFQLGSRLMRRILAAVTAVVGIGLVWSMSMIYSSLATVPAWNTPIVVFHFFMTALILGSLAMACALMITALVRKRNEDKLRDAPVDSEETSGGGVAVAARTEAKVETPTKGLVAQSRLRVQEINAPTTAIEWSLTTRVLQWLVIVAAVAGLLVLVSYPVYISALATGNAAAQESAAVFSGAFFVVRLLLLAVATGLLAVFAYQTAGRAIRSHPETLAAMIIGAFVLAVVAELMGRALHYEAMFGVGI